MGTGGNTDTDTDTDTKTKTDENINEDMNVNMNAKGNVNENENLNSNNSAECLKAEKEIQLKVHYAFRDFQKKMVRAQRKQQQAMVSTSSVYVFEQQNGQKQK